MTKAEKREAKQRQLREQRHARRKKEERAVYLILSFFLLLLVSAGILSYFLIGYGLAAREYNSLSKRYVIESAKTASDSIALAAETDEDLPDYPALQIDFEALSDINADFVGWIYVPGADCSYPLVQGDDNDFYLNRTFEKNSSNNGAIFLDSRDSKYLTGFNSFIYGHNMKNGSMFGNLKAYYTDQALIESYPYFYIYLPDETVMKYQIFSYYLTDGDSDSYDRPVNLEEESVYLDKITAKSSVKIEVEENRIGEYATLSTCSGAAGSGQRFLVHGACVGMFDAGVEEVAAR